MRRCGVALALVMALVSVACGPPPAEERPPGVNVVAAADAVVPCAALGAVMDLNAVVEPPGGLAVLSVELMNPYDLRSLTDSVPSLTADRQRGSTADQDSTSYTQHSAGQLAAYVTASGPEEPVPLILDCS